VSLGIATLISPWIAPLSYTDLLLQIFSWTPLAIPIPFYLYTYLGTQIEKTKLLVEKLVFLRTHHSIILENPKKVEIALFDTFEENISNEKKETILKAHELHPIILSHIDFLTKKIQEWKQEKKPLESPLSYVQKEFESLLDLPLFSPWVNLIIEKKRDWISNFTFDPPENLLLSISEEIAKTSHEPEIKEKAINHLQKLYWKWHQQETPSLETKWSKLFDLEEKILSAEMQRIFLWSFLLQPKETLQAALESHQIEIENALDLLVKKTNISLSDLSIAEKWHDPISQKAYLLPTEKAISRQDLLNPTKKEEILDKLLKTISSFAKKQTSSPKSVLEVHLPA
jgi:hypothetical protein